MLTTVDFCIDWVSRDVLKFISLGLVTGTDDIRSRSLGQRFRDYISSTALTPNPVNCIQASNLLDRTVVLLLIPLDNSVQLGLLFMRVHE